MSKNYFTQKTEDAIVAYNNSIDPVEKSRKKHIATRIRQHNNFHMAILIKVSRFN